MTEKEKSRLEKVVSLDHLKKLAEERRAVLYGVWRPIPASFFMNMTCRTVSLYIDRGDLRIWPKGGMK